MLCYTFKAYHIVSKGVSTMQEIELSVQLKLFEAYIAKSVGRLQTQVAVHVKNNTISETVTNLKQGLLPVSLSLK